MSYRLSDNLSYKFVALGVAVLLWMSMLGRKDTTMLKDFEVQVQTSPNFELVSQAPQFVKVEVSGPRVALKKVNQMSLVYTVDLSTAREGRYKVPLSRQGLNMPVGARVLDIDPTEISVVIRRTKAAAEGE